MFERAGNGRLPNLTMVGMRSAFPFGPKMWPMAIFIDRIWSQLGVSEGQKKLSPFQLSSTFGSEDDLATFRFGNSTKLDCFVFSFEILRSIELLLT